MYQFPYSIVPIAYTIILSIWGKKHNACLPDYTQTLLSQSSYHNPTMLVYSHWFICYTALRICSTLTSPYYCSTCSCKNFPKLTRIVSCSQLSTTGGWFIYSASLRSCMMLVVFYKSPRCAGLVYSSCCITFPCLNIVLFLRIG
jgi:hypothetical protein